MPGLLFWKVDKVHVPLPRNPIRKNLLTKLAFDFERFVFMNRGNVTLEIDSRGQYFPTKVALSIGWS